MAVSPGSDILASDVSSVANGIAVANKITMTSSDGTLDKGFINLPTNYFGDGSDGSLTYDGATTILGMAPAANVYTLTRDIFATTMTVNAGVTIKTNGYRIFCSTSLTMNNATTSIIQNLGNAAVLDVAGATPAANSVIGGAAGKTGGAAGNNSVGSPGVVSDSLTNCILSTMIGGTGGKGGDCTATGGGTARAGGAAATPAGSATVYSGIKDFMTITTMTNMVGPFKIGTAGCSGGGGADGGNGNTGGQGGGGGSTGGCVFIAAKTVLGTGTIKATGGVGGNGTATTQSTGFSRGGGGAGGGGCGGVIVMITRTTANPYTFTVTGGAPGTASAGVNGGATGDVGTSGATGTSFFLTV